MAMISTDVSVVEIITYVASPAVGLRTIERLASNESISRDSASIHLQGAPRIVQRTEIRALQLEKNVKFLVPVY